MLNVGDIVKLDTDERYGIVVDISEKMVSIRKRNGIVVEVNNNTVAVEWFRDNQQYRYFQQNLIKVSE
jgi:small-conductance mechanosensitive channel